MRGVGRVIVAAAVIMGVVFWAFVLTDDRTVKSFGLGLGVAILVDALIVRMLLVPAIMHLLGDARLVHPALARPGAPAPDHRAPRSTTRSRGLRPTSARSEELVPVG